MGTQSIILNPGNYIYFKKNKNIKKKISKYKFSLKEFKKFKYKNSKPFSSYQKKEMQLENLEKKPVINSFINTLKKELKKIKNYNFSVLFLIKFKNDKKLILD